MTQYLVEQRMDTQEFPLLEKRYLTKRGKRVLDKNLVLWKVKKKELDDVKYSG
jgi:hypothetical protein